MHIPILALFFPAPHSYTGEDSAELQLPGNPDLLERVIDTLLASAASRHLDARRAHPGEFTARAFFNGRISLTQAEGVAATIAALSDAQLRAARLLTEGALGRMACALADQLADALALVEAGIDFTDQEDVVAISPADLHRRLGELHQRITDQLSRAVGAEQLQAIPWVVLRGRPNAGKSALFNALLGRERAVVSPAAGTTRDVLAEPLTIRTSHGPAEVMLCDLAGLDDDDQSNLNQMMRSAALQAISRAELILRCVPSNDVHDAHDVNDASDYGAKMHSPSNELLIHTKCDLRTAVCVQPCAHRTSAMTGEGLADLRAEIGKRLAGRTVSLAGDSLALHPRHESAMRAAAANLAHALDLLQPHRDRRSMPDSELIASAMRAALNDLAELAGDITPDDVLGRVFATFCVGK